MTQTQTAAQDALEQARTSFAKSVTDISNWDLDQLERRLAENDAHEAARFMLYARSVADLAPDVIDTLPYFRSKVLLDDLMSAFGLLSGPVQQVLNMKPAQFRPESSGPHAQWHGPRDSLFQQFQANAPNPITRICAAMAYARASAWTTRKLDVMSTETQTALETARKHATEIEAIASKVRNVPAELTIKAFAKNFTDSAASYSINAYCFLAAAALLFGGALSYLYTADPVKDLPQVLTRALMISLFYAGLHFTLGAYRSHIHLRATYQHRAAVLSTCDLLLQSAQSDPETRLVMLREAASCIFQLGSTGFVRDADQRAEQQMLELARDIIVKKGAAS